MDKSNGRHDLSKEEMDKQVRWERGKIIGILEIDTDSSPLSSYQIPSGSEKVVR